jgi:heme exporter protein A
LINGQDPLVTAMSPAIELVNLTKKYGLLTALRDINLEINYGEAVAFLGPNGAGKSTILRIVAGQMVPTSGQVKVLDLDASRQAEMVKRNVGLVGHQSFLYDELTVDENLRFYGGFLDASPDEYNRVIEVTALERWRRTKARHLSYGLRKRADIARAMLGAPRMLVLDELFSGLDQDSCGNLIEHLTSIPNLTILISAHSLEWAKKLCHRGVYLRNGAVERDGEI